ncbi:2OG-Fe(II)-dependent halogenase WelO5 family protein [Streptomyces litchfieldiae]|uniref:Fe2OG dioxygenase domain-containing protein n=1 Tax=Streptomyces litchfieldiae TaxID=3075543 RepID=A0ABU2MR72_9ACTN|nr:hypothetical protein [Streptomyces sp. DSM 44938]MDT0343966.1 hypothetical protein [Streptomyces sp. DSM 44938]
MSKAQGTSSRLPLLVTGWEGDLGYFRFEEHTTLRPESIVEILRGRLAGVVFRGVIPAATCAELTDRFLTSPARRARGSDVPGQFVGAFHYAKTTDDYLRQAAATRSALDEILDMPDDPLAALRRELGDVLADEGVELRLARHDGREACPAILRSWDGEDEFALAPHEDYGQCTEPGQADFEIQRATAHQVVAMNMCLTNGAGGRLIVWNIKPDEPSRRRLGLQYTGVPYPLGSLAGVESMSLDVRPGDIYLFNGSHVHAVEPSADPLARRVTLSGLLGFIDEKTVVSWT